MCTSILVVCTRLNDLVRIPLDKLTKLYIRAVYLYGQIILVYTDARTSRTSLTLSYKAERPRRGRLIRKSRYLGTGESWGRGCGYGYGCGCCCTDRVPPPPPTSTGRPSGSSYRVPSPPTRERDPRSSRPSLRPAYSCPNRCPLAETLASKYCTSIRLAPSISSKYTYTTFRIHPRTYTYTSYSYSCIFILT